MNVSILVAADRNGVIGVNNTLPWRLSDDLKLFKKRTTGHVIVMGRKTYESIGRPLPERRNIVLSRSGHLRIPEVEVVADFEAALRLLEQEREVFVIGGSQIFDIARTYATRVYLTLVEAEVKGDAYFDYKPYLSWKLISEERFEKNKKNDFNFSVLTYEKPASAFAQICHQVPLKQSFDWH